MSALRTLLSPAFSGALLLTVPLTFFGTGCRALDKAYEAYCETADCDGGTPDGGDPDGGEEAEVVLTVDVPGVDDLAVGGECINGWVTTPPGPTVHLRQFAPSLADNPDNNARGPKTLFPGADCAAEATSQLVVEAGVDAQPVSFRAYTEDTKDEEHVIEARTGDEGAWTFAASFQVEPGRLSFDPSREPGTPYNALAEIPQIHLPTNVCVAFKGQLYGEESGREARLHAPGQLFLPPGTESPIEGLKLFTGTVCRDGGDYTPEELAAENGPELSGAPQLELSLMSPGPFSGCPTWDLRLEGAGQGSFQIYSGTGEVCP